MTGGRTSTLEGAGITNLGELTLENSTVTGNMATAAGASAAAGIFSSGPLTLDTVRIVANTSLGDGGRGAINSTAGGLTIERSTIAGNSGEVGIVGAGTATISDSTISGNTTAGGCRRHDLRFDRELDDQRKRRELRRRKRIGLDDPALGDRRGQ